MERDVKGMDNPKLLRYIRTHGDEKDDAAKELLSRLTGNEKWTHQQCRSFYEAALRHYIDDEDSLELLLAVSGFLDGYRSLRTASARRTKYSEYLAKNKPDSDDVDVDALRKRENKILDRVAVELERDLERGNIPRLVEEWTQEPKPENDPEPTEEGTQAAGRKTPQTGKDRSYDIINNFFINFHSLIDARTFKIPLIGVVLLVLLLVCVRILWPPTETPKNDPQPSLAPGQIYQYVIVSDDAVDVIEYISSDPSLLTVSPRGFILVHDGRPGEMSRSAEITAQNENGIIATETYTVDFTADRYEPPVTDINDFVPDFSVTQKVRLVGDTEWHNYVDAKVGDKIEFQTQYKNTDLRGNTHTNVAMRAILPSNLRYVQGSSKIYTVKCPDGLTFDQDTLVENGIYIGSYGVNSNAYVRFTAEVVDENLADGITGLVNWVQVSVDGVTLQDYSTIRVAKE